MIIKLFLCIAILLPLACKSGRESAGARKNNVKTNPKKSGANVWLITDRRSEKYHPRSSKPSTNKVVDNVSMEQWDCPRPEGVRYMPRATKEKIRRNMRLLNDELDGSQSSSGRTISQLAFRKGRTKNR
jgi:hypothetical protein